VKRKVVKKANERPRAQLSVSLKLLIALIIHFANEFYGFLPSVLVGRAQTHRALINFLLLAFFSRLEANIARFLLGRARDKFVVG
jgi:hypothetical protein